MTVHSASPPAPGRGLGAYRQSLRGVSRNCWLVFLAGSLAGLAQGVFAVDFNLYILELGIAPDTLGGILSAAPFAQALASIPINLLSEVLGFKAAFVVIFGVSGLAKVGQLVTTSVPLIAAASFVDGLAMAGGFVVRLPFLAANTEPRAQTQVYSINSMLFSVSMSLGSLLASHVPNVLEGVTGDLAGAYRATLLGAAVLTLLAVIPIFALRPTPPTGLRPLALRDYLWRVDRFVIYQAAITLFVGLSIGVVGPFMNLIFLYHLGATREFYGAVSALALIPAVVGAAAVPALATRTGSIVRKVTWLRLAVPLCLIAMAITSNPWVGTVGFWGQNTLVFMAAPLAFAFAMEIARDTRPVLSAWLNVAFWIGSAVAAPLTGLLIAEDRYGAALVLAAAFSVGAALLNQIWLAPIERAAPERS